MRQNLQIKAWMLLILFLSEIFSPMHLMALGSGPSQPEMASFTPAGTTEMVDPFSGDFSYNIPLMDVEGYPINIAYNSGVTMEQEASWVGLGWNLNVGTVNRSVRGLPDDFHGDGIEKETSMKPLKITKIGGGVITEVFGLVGSASVSKSLSFIYNNYKGFGLAYNTSIGGSIGPVSGGVGLDVNTLDGTSVNSNLGVSLRLMNNNAGTLSIGASLGSGYNTRTGQSVLSLGTTAGYKSPTLYDSDKGLTANVGSSTSLLPIGMNSYTPFQSIKMETKTVDFSGTLGAVGFAVNPAGRVFGSITTQELVDKNITTPSYGYIYAEGAKQDKTALQDFNREQQTLVNKTVKNLSPVNFTYDVFSVSGQGVSGMFRPFRNDIGVLSDPEYEIRSSNSQSFGGELGFGWNFHGGLSYNRVTLDAQFESWRDGNAAGDFQFQGKRVGKIYENVYFKAAGDLAESNNSYFNQIGGHDAIAFNLNGNDLAAQLTTSKGGLLGTLLSNNNDKRREPRSKVFSYLTAEEASLYALDYITSDTGKFYSGQYNSESIPRVSSIRKGHHISEITQINPDGERYVYGIPAYNLTKHEVVYTTEEKTPISGTNKTLYKTKDASKDNEEGIDHYFSRTKTPAYAHSFLLTAKLSSDYQDVTGDGISPDDVGTAHKFSYKRTSDSYKWRVPYNDVTLMEGYLSNELDQKGSYTYGEKELWYVSHIQSKNQVAEFYTSLRDDALGSGGIEGGKASVSDLSSRSHRLDSIVLYNKLDRLENKEQAVPLKKVSFIYDYSLCKGVENQISSTNDSGKLTLRSIEVTYGRNNLGKESPYRFNYSTTNPDYQSSQMDRWGNYKNSSENPESIENTFFPYTLQNQDDLTNDWSEAWNLTEIITPTGGSIQVEYEADDYAYVQNKKAMQMFPVIGASSSNVYDSTLASQGAYQNLYNGQYLFIKRPNEVPNDLSDDQLERLFLGEAGKLDNMYYKFLTSIGSSKNEYSPGYTTALNMGYCSDRSVLYVQIPNESPSAISNATFGYFRHSLFEVLYKQPTVNDNAVESVARGISANINDIKQMFMGVKNNLTNRNIANRFVPKASFIRLNTPDGIKKGGGSRVKRIVMNDNWNAMSGEGENSTYGQEYIYQTTDNLGRAISSGVASYEPFIGGEENPFKLPVSYTAVAAAGHIPAIDAYQERPFGESFFPTASVGYSKVLVKNIHYKLGKSSQGITEHLFYTAKDFPVLVDETTIKIHESLPGKTKFTMPLSSSTARTKFAASQGYSITLNDMHGKPLSTRNYLLAEDEDDNGNKIILKKLFSGKKYNYHFEQTPAGKRLKNEVEVLTEDGFIKTKQLGVEIDVAVENRRTHEENKTIATHLSYDFFFIPLGFIIIPVNFPTGGGNELKDIKEMRYQVVTKTIQQYGLIESVEIFTDQFKQIISNKLYDGLSGRVILTKTEDEYNKDEYQLDLPAYTVQGNEKMGSAYQTIGFEFSVFPKAIEVSCNPNNTAFDFNHKNLVKHGDEVLVKRQDGSSERAWIKLDEDNAYNVPVSTCDPIASPDTFSGRLLTFFMRQTNGSIEPTGAFQKGKFKRNHSQILDEVKIYHLKSDKVDLYSDALDSLVDLHECEVLTTNYSYNYALNKINHVYHSSNCSIAGVHFYEAYDSITTTFLKPSINPDLSERLNDTNKLFKIFDLADTLHANIELLELRARKDSSLDCWATTNGTNASNVLVRYHNYANFPNEDFYTVRNNPCVEFSQVFNHLGLDTGNSIRYNPYTTAGIKGPWQYLSQRSNNSGIDFYRRDPGTKDTAKIVSTSKMSQASFLIEAQGSFRPYLEQEEQLYLVEYQLRNNKTGDTTSAYFIENGRGFEGNDLPSYMNLKVSCSNEDTIVPADPCVNNYRLIDRNGTYLNVSNVKSLKILRPANRNELMESAGNMVSNINPIKTDRNNDKFEGFQDYGSSSYLIQANGQLFQEKQNIVYNYPVSDNPFVSGYEGTFRMDSSLFYMASRSQSDTVETPNDGYLEELPELWTSIPCYDGLQAPSFNSEDKSSGWKFSERVTKYDENGRALESVSNLQIPSSQVVDYKGLTEIRGGNITYHNLAYDGFENYFNFGRSGAQSISGFRFLQSTTADTSVVLLNEGSEVYEFSKFGEDHLIKGIAHTGEYSMFVNREAGPETNLTITYPVKSLNSLEQIELGREFLEGEADTITVNENTERDVNYNAFTANLSSELKTSISNALTNSANLPQKTFTLNAGDSSGNFKPESGKFLISVWMKELIASDKPYKGISPELVVTNNGQTYTFHAEGPEIEGWRKIEGIIEYEDSQSLSITFVGGKWGAFYDDFRIHKSNSNVNTYVYERYSNRLKAMLDENNYAVFYEYDPSGIPSQVKRETEEGIYTVSESRKSFSK